MRVLHWFVKGLLSYVHVKAKAHASMSTLVSTTLVVQEVTVLEEDGQALRDAASDCGKGKC